MNKIPCTSQNTKAKTLPAYVCVFGCFHLLLSSQLIANLTLNWHGWSMFHPFSHIYVKTPFCCIETVANNTPKCQHVFDQLWTNATPTFNTDFWLTNVHAKWWIHCFLIPSTPLQSHATSIYDHPKRDVEFYSAKFGQTAFSIACVCKTTFKVSIHPLNRCFQLSRFRITLI